MVNASGDRPLMIDQATFNAILYREGFIVNTDKRLYLKIKLKYLANESRIIRKEERKRMIQMPVAVAVPVAVGDVSFGDSTNVSGGSERSGAMVSRTVMI